MFGKASAHSERSQRTNRTNHRVPLTEPNITYSTPNRTTTHPTNHTQPPQATEQSNSQAVGQFRALEKRLEFCGGFQNLFGSKRTPASQRQKCCGADHVAAVVVLARLKPIVPLEHTASVVLFRVRNQYWGGHPPRTPNHPNFSDPKPGDTFQLNENNKCTTKSSCKIETCRS